MALSNDDYKRFLHLMHNNQGFRFGGGIEVGF